MNSKFMIGEEVVCKIGGPKMIVNGISDIDDSTIYSCLYWTDMPGQNNYFSAYNIHEANLDYYKGKTNE